jgi:ubiquinone/menaquinone biosynthesis C-methylase UbiE
MNEGFLNPEQIINSIPLKSNMVACDFGCGSGGWVIPLAKKLEDGTVYAIDILEGSLSALSSKASNQNITNIKTILGDIESGPKVKEDYFDLVLVTNLLFQIEKKEQVLQSAMNILKNGGLLLVIDWKKDASMGSKEGRLSLLEAKEIGEKVGFKVEKEFNAGSFHWAIIFKKS